jgi:hypothetical protein
MLPDTSIPAGPANPRPPADAADLRFWLENMVGAHGYSTAEVASATGLSQAEADAAIRRLGLAGRALPARSPLAPLRVLPYPGGRHPRLGFFEGTDIEAELARLHGGAGPGAGAPMPGR